MNYYMYTNTGEREINEDYVACSVNDNCGCFVLADGLGGHGKGEVASELVVKTALEIYEGLGNGEDSICKAFEVAQINLLEEQERQKQYDAMKTTMVMCCISDKEIQWGHIGDSRLYIFKNKRFKIRTIDHSVPQMLALSGDIKEKDIRFHPDRNRLLKVMGTPWNKPEYEISASIKRKKNQAILMCSDGFWEYVTEKQMIQCLKIAKNAQEWLELMVDIVRESESEELHDNFSAICIWC